MVTRNLRYLKGINNLIVICFDKPSFISNGLSYRIGTRVVHDSNDTLDLGGNCEPEELRPPSSRLGAL